ncbi:MAG: hypothetical protein RIS35_2350 [Pseudomonadota bacterium]
MTAPKDALHRVRIIGGQWKRTPLQVVDAPGLRPTPDRVRETLFNWLGRDLSTWRCLDLFAGTGALGLEAASRGAAEVWLVEPERRVREAIAQTLRRLDARQVRLFDEPAARALSRARAADLRFDLVLLDPPFGQGWLDRILPALGPVLSDRARVYVESDAPLDSETVRRLMGPGFRLDRQDRAGQVFYHLIVRSPAQEA